MVETDFYKEILTRPELAEQARKIRLLFNAVGARPEEVGKMVAAVAAQEPGKLTGRQYAIIHGWRSLRGKLLLAWYGVTGKMK